MQEDSKEPQLQPVTVKGKAFLERELKRLLSKDRTAVIAAIEVARALGDLKENAEYHAAKEQQSLIMARIDYIKGVLGSAEVIEPSSLSLPHIAFGSTVTLCDLDKDEEVTYQVVGIDESDIKKGKLSYNSPLARALIGKRVGDEVGVKTPKGHASYEVSSIQYI